jgi:hypothetical protein
MSIYVHVTKRCLFCMCVKSWCMRVQCKHKHVFRELSLSLSLSLTHLHTHRQTYICLKTHTHTHTHTHSFDARTFLCSARNTLLALYAVLGRWYCRANTPRVSVMATTSAVLLWSECELSRGLLLNNIHSACVRRFDARAGMRHSGQLRCVCLLSNVKLKWVCLHMTREGMPFKSFVLPNITVYACMHVCMHISMCVCEPMHVRRYSTHTQVHASTHEADTHMRQSTRHKVPAVHACRAAFQAP